MKFYGEKCAIMHRGSVVVSFCIRDGVLVPEQYHGHHSTVAREVLEGRQWLNWDDAARELGRRIK